MVLANHLGPQRPWFTWYVFGRICHLWLTGSLVWDGQTEEAGRTPWGLQSVVPPAIGTARTLGSNLIGDGASPTAHPLKMATGSTARATRARRPEPKSGWAPTSETLNQHVASWSFTCSTGKQGQPPTHHSFRTDQHVTMKGFSFAPKVRLAF